MWWRAKRQATRVLGLALSQQTHLIKDFDLLVRRACRQTVPIEIVRDIMNQLVMIRVNLPDRLLKTHDTHGLSDATY